MYVDSQEPTVMVLLIVEDIQKSFTETLADSIWYSVMVPQLVSSQFIREMTVAAYDIIYRPITAGYVEGSDEEAIDTVTDASQKFIFRNWSRSFGENALLLASNMDDVTINPETGNEDGYDTAIQATVAAESLRQIRILEQESERALDSDS